MGDSTIKPKKIPHQKRHQKEPTFRRNTARSEGRAGKWVSKPEPKGARGRKEKGLKRERGTSPPGTRGGERSETAERERAQSAGAAADGEW